jgi:hypothetical protein
VAARLGVEFSHPPLARRAIRVIFARPGAKSPSALGLRVGACSIDGFNDPSIVMRFGWSLEDVGPSIDKETDIGGMGRLSSAPHAVDLIDCRAERSIRRKAVLQLAACRPRVLVLSQP